MQFNITSRIAPPVDCFMVEVHTYQGDSNGNSVFTVGPFRRGADEASLQSLIETLDRVRENFRWGNPDRLPYHDDILGFLHWFDSTDYSDMNVLRDEHPEVVARYGVEVHEELARLAEGWYPEWPWDQLIKFGPDDRTPVMEKLEKYLVFYYDTEGDKFSVEVEVDK